MYFLFLPQNTVKTIKLGQGSVVLKCCFIFQSGRIGADEEIDDFKGRPADEVEEIQAEKEAKTRAILLEMVNLSLSLPHQRECFLVCICTIHIMCR